MPGPLNALGGATHIGPRRGLGAIPDMRVQEAGVPSVKMALLRLMGQAEPAVAKLLPDEVSRLIGRGMAEGVLPKTATRGFQVAEPALGRGAISHAEVDRLIQGLIR